MNFNIYIDDQLGDKLLQFSKTTGKTKNAIIRQAVEELLSKSSPTSWPRSIIEFKGIKDFESFEASRYELKEPEEKLFL